MKDKKVTKVFLNNVKLSGYKSIKNVDIDIKDGLNIVIGKNAAGKTNFLSFLDKTLDFKNDVFYDFNTELSFKGEKLFSVKSENKSRSKAAIIQSTFKIKLDFFSSVIFSTFRANCKCLFVGNFSDNSNKISHLLSGLNFDLTLCPIQGIFIPDFLSYKLISTGLTFKENMFHPEFKIISWIISSINAKLSP